MPDTERQHLRITAARFAAAAASYTASAEAQQLVASGLDSFLENLPAPPAGRRIVEIGCGTGLFTELLAARFPQCTVEAVDLAPAMIATASHRLGLPKTRVRWLAGDVRDLAANGDCGLLISASALQWLQPLPAAMRHLAGMLAADGILAAAMMVEGTLGELHALRGGLFPDKPYGLRLPAATSVAAALAGARLQTIRMEERQFQIRRENAWELLKTLHAQGVTPATGHRLNRRELRELAAAYDRLHRDAAGGTPASYRVLFFAARHDGVRPCL